MSIITTKILSSAIATFLSTALSIWSVACMWIIFKKAGRKWWEAIIPVWNLYVLFKIAWKLTEFWILILLPIVWLIHFVLIWCMDSGSDNLAMIASLFSRILWICSFLFPLIAWLELPYWLTKKFWKSNWFYIWMLFLYPIFMWILAFSDAKYEEKEVEKVYSWGKWLLISLWVGLLIWLWDWGSKYYTYSSFMNAYDDDYNYESSYDYNYDYSDDDNYNYSDVEQNTISIWTVRWVPAAWSAIPMN